MNIKEIILAISLLLLSTVANAKYCATGEIEGIECTGFIIKSCSFIKINAIKGDDATIYDVKKCYKSVSDYDPSTNACTIQTKSNFLGFFGDLIKPKFLHLNNKGKYDSVDTDAIIFKCAKY